MPRNQYSDQTYLKLDIDNRDIMENRLQSKIKEAIDEFTTQSNQITDGYGKLLVEKAEEPGLIKQ